MLAGIGPDVRRVKLAKSRAKAVDIGLHPRAQGGTFRMIVKA
jgi:hypothetical protein